LTWFFEGKIKMNLVDLVGKNARLYPNDIAYVEIRPVSKVRKEISWIQFHERTNRLANALIGMGIKKGGSVLLLGKNSIGWLEAYFAVLKTGAWIVPLNFRFTTDDILYCAAVAEPVAFIFDESYAEMIEAIRQSTRSIQHYFCLGKGPLEGVETLEKQLEGGASNTPEFPLGNEEACALYFTSGTTGDPKPVLLSHANLICIATGEAINNNIRQTDRFLMMPPLYHLAIGHLFGLLLRGGRTVLLTEKITPTYILESMDKEKISFVFLLVPWALDLLESLDKGKNSTGVYNLSYWRLIVMGAQAIPPSVVHRLKEYFPKIQYSTVYGLSEGGGPGQVELGVENEHKIGAIGKATMLWDARIVDDKGQDVSLGEVGELIIKGNGVMHEYYKNPELTAQTIRKGWLYTGDLARMDDDGFIFLVDRKKDLVISGGENIFPIEIEEIIRLHPHVYDVAVIGMPDERLGEVVTAVIQTVSGKSLSHDEISAFCEEKLPRYKRPRSIIFDTVPRSATGKIEKPKLRDKYC
jgi:acyl-CoA synthetase (AMP-forming)/AMP-acid ligase II